MTTYIIYESLNCLTHLLHQEPITINPWSQRIPYKYFYQIRLKFSLDY